MICSVMGLLLSLSMRPLVVLSLTVMHSSLSCAEHLAAAQCMGDTVTRCCCRAGTRQGLNAAAFGSQSCAPDGARVIGDHPRQRAHLTRQGGPEPGRTRKNWRRADTRMKRRCCRASTSQRSRLSVTSPTLSSAVFGAASTCTQNMSVKQLASLTAHCMAGQLPVCSGQLLEEPQHGERSQVFLDRMSKAAHLYGAPQEDFLDPSFCPGALPCSCQAIRGGQG